MDFRLKKYDRLSMRDKKKLIDKKFKKNKIKKPKKYRKCGKGISRVLLSFVKNKKKYHRKTLLFNEVLFNKNPSKIKMEDCIMAVSLNAMNWAYDRGSQRKIKFFMQKAGIAVLGEDYAGAGITLNEHNARVTFANKVLDGTASVLEYAIGVVTNATISATIDGGNQPSDSDLEFAVNSVFSDFSGWDPA